jgi:hypothetical protein
MFLSMLVTNCQTERKRRRKGVQLMFQSKNFEAGQPIDFESFLAIVPTLGFQGSNQEVFALFREANLLGAGVMSLESFIRAMDSLPFHFYSIDVPMTNTKKNDATRPSRQQIVQHWQRFCSWFVPFRQVIPEFGPWLRSSIIARVRRGERLFKENEGCRCYTVSTGSSWTSSSSLWM